MLPTQLKSISAVLLVAGLCVVGPGILTHRASAQKTAPGKPAAADEFSGRVKAVDAGKLTITLTLNATKAAPAEDRTFEVAKDAQIAVGAKGATLADVTATQWVTLTLKGAMVVAVRTADKNPAASMTSLQGELKAVRAERHSITVTLPGGKNQPGEDRTFEVTPDAKITIDYSKAGKLADLPAGSQVQLSVSKEEKVEGISAVGPTLVGMVRSSDEGKSTITIAVGGLKGAPLEDRTVAVAREVRIALDKTKSLKLGDLPAGGMVALTMSVDQKTAIAVHLRSSRPDTTSIRGEISAIDAASDKLKVAIGRGKGETPEERSFYVPKAAKILMDLDRSATLSELKPGALVTLELSPDQNVVLLKAVGPTITGVLKAVDAAKHAISVAISVNKNEPGETKDYVIASEAKVLINKAQAAKLAELSPGMRVTLTLSVDLKTVIGLMAASQ